MVISHGQVNSTVFMKRILNNGIKQHFKNNIKKVFLFSQYRQNKIQMHLYLQNRNQPFLLTHIQINAIAHRSYTEGDGRL